MAERLARLDCEEVSQRHSRRDRLRAIAQDTAQRLAGAPESTEIGDLLYDSRGLPG